MPRRGSPGTESRRGDQSKQEGKAAEKGSETRIGQLVPHMVGESGYFPGMVALAQGFAGIPLFAGNGESNPWDGRIMMRWARTCKIIFWRRDAEKGEKNIIPLHSRRHCGETFYCIFSLRSQRSLRHGGALFKWFLWHRIAVRDIVVVRKFQQLVEGQSLSHLSMRTELELR
jgi:hypothetical protein